MEVVELGAETGSQDEYHCVLCGYGIHHEVVESFCRHSYALKNGLDGLKSYSQQASWSSFVWSCLHLRVRRHRRAFCGALCRRNYDLCRDGCVGFRLGPCAFRCGDLRVCGRGLLCLCIDP